MTAFLPQPTTFRNESGETRTIAGTFTQADFTSIAGDLSDSTLTLASGNPVTSGLNVGDKFALTGTAQDATYTITGFSGTQSRVMAVTPAPAGDFGADTSFTMTLSNITFDAQGTGSFNARLCLAGATAPAFYVIGGGTGGTSPVATQAGGVMLPNGAYEYIKLNSGEKVAVTGTDGLINFSVCTK